MNSSPKGSGEDVKIDVKYEKIPLLTLFRENGQLGVEYNDIDRINAFEVYGFLILETEFLKEKILSMKFRPESDDDDDDDD